MPVTERGDLVESAWVTQRMKRLERNCTSARLTTVHVQWGIAP